MREVVVCEPLRTPIGRFGGVFATVAPADLAAAVIAALLERSGIDGGVIDDVILGQAYPTAEAASVARVAARIVPRGIAGGLQDSHRGMFPCFLGGRVARFVLSALSALITTTRVAAGSITPSSSPRSAARNGDATL